MNGVRGIQAGGRFAVHEIDERTKNGTGGGRALLVHERHEKHEKGKCGTSDFANESNESATVPMRFNSCHLLATRSLPSAAPFVSLVYFVDKRSACRSPKPKVVDQPGAAEEDRAG